MLHEVLQIAFSNKQLNVKKVMNKRKYILIILINLSICVITILHITLIVTGLNKTEKAKHH